MWMLDTIGLSRDDAGEDAGYSRCRLLRLLLGLRVFPWGLPLHFPFPLIERGLEQEVTVFLVVLLRQDNCDNKTSSAHPEPRATAKGCGGRSLIESSHGRESFGSF